MNGIQLNRYGNGDFVILVLITKDYNTQKQMEDLFEVSHATISEHIGNILADGELDETSVGFSDKSTGGRKPRIYNLDMIISVGYRVNSKLEDGPAESLKTTCSKAMR